MGIYVFIEAFVGIVAGILLAVCTKKAEGVTYNSLDKAGQITNLALLLGYLLISPLYLFIGILCTPAYEGVLGVIGWIVSAICASVAFFCATGLGLSVAFRKKGRSKLSFAVQFAGAAALVLMLLLFALFYGNLLRSLN